MECGFTCCKFLMFSFNLIFALCSLALLLLAVLAQVTILPYYSIEQVGGQSAPMLTLPQLLWIIIIVSVFAFLLAFIGCLGAVCESRCLFLFFGTMLTLIFLVEVATIIVGINVQDQVLQQVESSVNASLPYYLNNTEITRFWDALQTDLNCCGLKDPSDWRDVFKNSSLPGSCCSQIAVGETCMDTTETVSHEGCLQTILYFLHSKTAVIYGVAGVVGIIEIFGIIISLFLAFTISEQYRTV